MSRQTFRLILIVSSAHALVHIFELSLPSVEQLIGEEFHVGREYTGALGTAWRLPFGLGALLAGWLADRYGSKPLLIIYLIGCVATSVLAFLAPTLNGVFLAMFAMGCFASIYHPAGLALISRETTPANRPAALGWHGIVGSLGIASAPFIAGVAFSVSDITWRQYYLLLTIPAVIVILMLVFLLHEHRQPKPLKNAAPGNDNDQHGNNSSNDSSRAKNSRPAEEDDETAQWRTFLLLVVVGALSGFVYAAFMHFLPRYLDGAGIRPASISPESFRNYLATMVLLFAVVGQAIAGRLASPGRLEIQLSGILLLNVPALLWMAYAEGAGRLWATCTLALVHFMNQPVYNSLIAQYVPRSRRSVGYGFSNMICFGIGALGPAFAGLMQTERATYGGLAVMAGLAGLLAICLRPRIPK